MAEKRRIPKICKKCDWRRIHSNNSQPVRDYSNTMCVYTPVTGEFKETRATDEHCEAYKPRTTSKMRSL